MRRSPPFLLSSWTLALVLTLTTLVGGVTASSRTAPAGAATGAQAAHERGTLCIVKFNDLDGDGQQDPGEPTLFGWVFTIKDANGNVVGTITTVAGALNCIDLPPGTYTVTETLPAGWTPTTPGGTTQTVTVVAGQTTRVTFGNHQTENGRICVVKFNDLNGDGKQDPGEPTLFGWVFTIKDATGNVVGTITTTAGATNCINLPPGTYTVTETLPAGWTPTTTGGVTQTVTVVSGQTTTVTFGNRQTENGRICVVKFNDLNGDGKQDPGEPTLFGWVFTIKDANGNVVGTITTTAGATNCINLPPGTYTVTETLQPGWHATTAGGVTQTVTVVVGQTTNVIFGNHRCCLTFTFLGGKIDNFSLGNGATAEPVTPVTPALIPPTAAYFDATASNVRFGHRFYLGTGNCIQSATLQIKIKALPGGSTNDTMGIKAGGSSWAKPISAISPTGTWTPPTVKTVLFNLGAMPSGGGSTNLIPALNSTRVLDIRIQDDTRVDYIKLIVVFCECVHK